MSQNPEIAVTGKDHGGLGDVGQLPPEAVTTYGGVDTEFTKTPESGALVWDILLSKKL